MPYCAAYCCNNSHEKDYAFRGFLPCPDLYLNAVYFIRDEEQSNTELFLQAVPFYITLLVEVGRGRGRGN